MAIYSSASLEVGMKGLVFQFLRFGKGGKAIEVVIRSENATTDS
jgi:hypothetical protein